MKRVKENSGDGIRFSAKLLRPSKEQGADWTFVKLPVDVSKKMPSRGMVSVEGVMNGVGFVSTLRPDGDGGHWMKIEGALSAKVGVKAGDEVTLEISPTTEEPEPDVPNDLKKALEGSDPKTRETWAGITAAARRDWIHWIESAKRQETRIKRIETGCDMLKKGNRRPCCFDRSGMYSKSLSCPEAEE